MAAVRIVNLSKKFGNVPAVIENTIEINDKEFCVLVGPSGCGKTTTLRCVAGLETPDSGNIYIGDEDVTNMAPRERDVALVFQNYALYPHLSVRNNIAFPLKIRKVPKDEIDRRVKDVVELLRIDHLLDRKPRQLSGGEAQRVALGRAIVRKPRVFLMDEPLSNLDANLRLYMRAELKRLQKDLETTTIYVTHDQAEAMTMADKVAVMNAGRVQQLGKPEEIYSHPRNTFVAGFVGSPPMNFLDCTLVPQDGGVAVDGGTFRFQLPKEISGGLTGLANSEAVLGIRPENLSIARGKVDPSIRGEVYVIEPLGSETIVTLKIGDKFLKIKSPPGTQLSLREQVDLTFSPNMIRLFDRRSGDALA